MPRTPISPNAYWLNELCLGRPLAGLLLHSSLLGNCKRRDSGRPRQSWVAAPAEPFSLLLDDVVQFPARIDNFPSAQIYLYCLRLYTQMLLLLCRKTGKFQHVQLKVFPKKWALVLYILKSKYTITIKQLVLANR